MSEEVLFLDGRYFEKVFKTYPGRIMYPFHVTIDTRTNPALVSTDLVSNVGQFNSVGLCSDLYLLRLIIQVINDTGVIFRHSNLLIFNRLTKTVLRYEPLAGAPYENIVNEVITRDLKMLDRFKGYLYEELQLHPQADNTNLGLCVAYIIKLAEDLLLFMPTTSPSETEILEYSMEIVKRFGEFPAGSEQDVEFGFGGFGGALLGTALIGGLIAAPAIAAASSPRTTVIYR